MNNDINNNSKQGLILAILIALILLFAMNYKINYDKLNYIKNINNKEIGYQKNYLMNITKNVEDNNSFNIELEFNAPLNGANVKILYGNFSKCVKTEDLLFSPPNHVGDLSFKTQNAYSNTVNFSVKSYEIKELSDSLDIAILLEDEIVYRDRISLVTK